MFSIVSASHSETVIWVESSIENDDNRFEEENVHCKKKDNMKMAFCRFQKACKIKKASSTFAYHFNKETVPLHTNHL
jgi:hypothetical protein